MQCDNSLKNQHTTLLELGKGLISFDEMPHKKIDESVWLNIHI